MSSRPNIGPESKLDFSEFHPLDHNVLECRGYPGGRRRHLAFRWDFFVNPWIHSRTLCAVGVHTRTGQAWRRQPDGNWLTWTSCVWCLKRMSEVQPD